MRRKSGKVHEERPVVLVLTEDTASVTDYVRTLARNASRADRVSINVIGLGYDPEKLLESARTALNGGNRSIPPASYVLLAYDRDRHAHFEKVTALIRREENIESFVSIPCFEYFFLLHFRFTRSPFNDFAQLSPQLRACDGFSRYEKARHSIPIVGLADLYGAACENAKRGRSERRVDGAPTPYTEIDLLFDAIDGAKRLGLDHLIASRADRDKDRV